MSSSQSPSTIVFVDEGESLLATSSRQNRPTKAAQNKIATIVAEIGYRGRVAGKIMSVIGRPAK